MYFDSGSMAWPAISPSQGSNETNFTSFGSCEAAAASFCACSAPETTTTFAPQLSICQAICGPVNVECTAT